MNRLFRSLVGFATVVALVVPTVTQAAFLPAPTNLTIVGGAYTNDTTPTFTWSRSTGATWYEVALDAEQWRGIGNNNTYTSLTLSSGWHTFYLRARNNYGDVSGNVWLTFEIDQQGPTVPAVWPTTAEEDEDVELSVTPYGEAQVLQCRLIVSGTDTGYMDRRGGTTFYKDYTFTQEGSYVVYARCTDADGNTTNGTTRTITVSDQYDDEDDEDGHDEVLSVPRVSPATATEDERTEITVRPTGDYNITNCWLYVNGRRVEEMDEESTNSFVADYTFTNDDEYTVYATCEDSRGNETRGDSRTITVYEEDEVADREDVIEVPRVSPSSALEDRRTEFSVRPSGDNNITECSLYVNNRHVAEMDEESTNYFVTDYTFTNEGTYTVHAYCEDSRGNGDTGEKRTVTVTDHYDYEDDDDSYYFGDLEGELIKTACPTNSLPSDPCRAVYFYGEDGYRHAFPNESTFFTWYEDFDDVITISKDEMNEIPLGRNVTYRPGSVLIKFASDSTIYAIEEPNYLREYTSTSLLRSDYGSDYSSVVVTLPDYLFSSYRTGSDIDSSADFDRTDAYYSVDDLRDIF